VPAKFVQFTNARANEPPILINPDHVRAAYQSGSNQVTLDMGSGEGGVLYHVEGDLKSVLAKLEEQRSVSEQKRSPFTSP
jgi:hypothetical protein